MFAVMGVTGKVGGAAASALLAAGEDVRVIVRDADKGRAWAARGCQVAIASLEDSAALAHGFAGAEGMFAMLPPLFDPMPGFPEARAMIASLRAAIDAAAPPRLVALSTIGADAAPMNLLSQLGLLEAGLAGVKARTTFLRAAWFMDNAAWDLPAARAGAIRSHLQPAARRIAMIASADVGRTAAALLREADAPAIVELEAASRISPDDIAAAFARALGHPVGVETVARDRWEAQFRDAGMANPQPRIRMIDGFNQGWIDFADHGAHARKGALTIDDVIAGIVARG